MKKKEIVLAIGKSIWYCYCIGLVAVSSQSVTTCSICPNGEDITKPDQPLIIEGAFPIDTCGTLNSVTPFIPKDSTDCEGIQRLSTLCGCTVPENGCQLCTDGQITSPEQDDSKIPDHLLDPAYKDSDIKFTCQVYQALLQSYSPQDQICLEAAQIATACGCTRETVGTQNTTTTTTTRPTDNNTTMIELSGCPICPDNMELKHDDELVYITRASILRPHFGALASCGEIENPPHSMPHDCDAIREAAQDLCPCQLKKDQIAVPSKKCTACYYGEPIPYPDRPFEFAEGALPISTCGGLEYAAGVYENGTVGCVNIQALGKACGCRIPPNTCALCPGGQPIPEPDKKYKFFANIKDTDFHEMLSRPLRCDIFDSMLASPSMDDEMCIASTFRSGACGCENKFVSAITLITRISGSVSCACSLFIILFVIFSPKQRQKTYNQIVLTMSIFDFCSSIGFAFASSLAPEELGIQGAKGNDATCKFQGFLIELGITSTVFNLCLSVYYWLVIVRGWTDSDLQKYRGYVYVGSIIIGLSLATTGFPYYISSFRECHIHPPPMAESWWPIILLYIVPISLCILGSTTAIVLVILHVRRKEIRSKQFSARSKKSSLTRKCVKQAFYYLAAFYLVWPFMFVPIFLPLSENLQWLYVLTSIIGPSQGLFNFLIFFQRRNTQMNTFFCCRKSTADTNPPRVPPVTSGLQSSDDECSTSWTLPNTFNAIWEHCHHAQL